MVSTTAAETVAAGQVKTSCFPNPHLLLPAGGPLDHPDGDLLVLLALEEGGEGEGEGACAAAAEGAGGGGEVLVLHRAGLEGERACMRGGGEMNEKNWEIRIRDKKLLLCQQNFFEGVFYSQS